VVVCIISLFVSIAGWPRAGLPHPAVYGVAAYWELQFVLLDHRLVLGLPQELLAVDPPRHLVDGQVVLRLTQRLMPTGSYSGRLGLLQLSCMRAVVRLYSYSY
jgi:hypothetical protein